MDQKHLTEQEIALVAEALVKENYNQLDNRIREHLAICNCCADEALVVSELIADQKSDSKDSQPDSITIASNRNKMNFLWIAASLAICFGIAYWSIEYSNRSAMYAHIENTPSNVVSKVMKDSLEVLKPKPVVVKQKVTDKKTIVSQTTQVKKPLLAYQTNPQMEALVERFTNEAHMRGGQIEVVSKSLIKGELNKIELRWKNPDKAVLILEIFDNKGTKLSEIETQDSIFHPTQLNQPGLYYWKLIDEDFEMIFCGRIVVK
ncbi:MAG: hypothetical protein ACEPOZ_12385 [Marinifilaceae bacterium]